MRKGFIKLCCLIMVSAMLIGTASCGSKDKKPNFTTVGANGSRTDDALGFQFDLPASGDEYAVIETSEGTLKVRLFPESAPIGVANFIGLCKKGYYDGLSFHRIVTDFVAQSGDPDGIGSGGDSLWGGEFATETNKNLLHFYGALAYANRGAGTNTSQFYFVTTKTVDSVSLSYADNSAIEMYKEKGGQPYLDSTKAYTVFGQVFEGFDVLDAINACGSSESTGTPTKDVTIIKATIQTF